jgi:hypothetical protein
MVGAMLAAAVVFTAMLQATLARHGVNCQFDLSQTIAKEGTVTRVRFVNPHSYVCFNVTQDDGTVVNCVQEACCAVKAGRQRCSRRVQKSVSSDRLHEPNLRHAILEQSPSQMADYWSAMVLSMTTEIW